MTREDHSAFSAQLAEQLKRAESKADGEAAMHVAALVVEMMRGDSARGNLGTLKQLRKIVLSTLLVEGADPASVRSRLEDSALTPVLAEYFVWALARFEPVQDEAKKVRASFVDAFGVTFSRGSAPLTKSERIELSTHFHLALGVCGKWLRRQTDRVSPQLESGASLPDSPLKAEHIDAAFRRTFKV